jgi:hypothetical protein
MADNPSYQSPDILQCTKSVSHLRIQALAVEPGLSSQPRHMFGGAPNSQSCQATGKS